jgi:hypothetical protein
VAADSIISRKKEKDGSTKRRGKKRPGPEYPGPDVSKR